ncbi:hypothetical protein [Croceitalea vernalis]|uniref:ATP synthase F0 subunit 8 n=1 Tax=Croceitalea vernalis TaxID=3075599 RepID=A0ABU3BJ69_9FLAO|nr:hypothetical protein [Croceitalea sp. P007]MDT0622196.1 hypothetical protein [Croceitalea sp. P007]
MISFFFIFFSLLAMNILFLILSSKGILDRFKKPLMKTSETPIAKLFPTEYSETKYKKAV